MEDADVEEEDVGEWGELFNVQANIYWNFHLIHMYTIHVDLIKSHQKSHLSIALPVFFFFMIQQKYLRFWGNHFWADYRRWLAWPCWVGSMNGAFLWFVNCFLSFFLSTNWSHTWNFLRQKIRCSGFLKKTKSDVKWAMQIENNFYKSDFPVPSFVLVFLICFFSSWFGFIVFFEKSISLSHIEPLWCRINARGSGRLSRNFLS